MIMSNTFTTMSYKMPQYEICRISANSIETFAAVARLVVPMMHFMSKPPECVSGNLIKILFNLIQ